MPEGKYYWTVSDPGLDDHHAVNGTVDIESPRTSVVDARVHKESGLERSEGYWRCVSTNSVLNGGGVEDRVWATPPGWLAIDDQFILTWDASGKLIGNWSLKRNADSSPKTLDIIDIIDILTGDSIGEGQWAVSQKKLLLRLYPPRKTTLPYLTSIFSKPTNGDLLEWRFDKLPGPPAWLDPDLAAEAEESVELEARSNVDVIAADDAGSIMSTVSAIDGRWIVQSVTKAESFNVKGFSPDNREWVIAGEWILFVDHNGKTTKGLISTLDDTSPRRIIVQSKQGSVLWVMVGVYHLIDDTLQCCFLIPDKPDTDASTPSDENKEPKENVATLTDDCFYAPPTPGRLVVSFRKRIRTQQNVFADTPLPNVQGIVIDTKRSEPSRRHLVEIIDRGKTTDSEKTTS